MSKVVLGVRQKMTSLVEVIGTAEGSAQGYAKGASCSVLSLRQEARLALVVVRLALVVL